MPEAVVVGAGIAGLATSLFAARAGAHVILLEGDAHPPPENVDHSLNRWHRPGVPQLGQGHNIHGLARLVLRECAPDVLRSLFAVGVAERRFGTGPAAGDPSPDDEGLSALLVRRSVFEWVLRAAVMREPRVSIRAGVRVTGLGHTADNAAARGVMLASGEVIEAPWVIDASGRRSVRHGWLEQLSAGPVRYRTQKAHTSYYARHFRLRPGRSAPPGDWLFGPAGDVGYLRYSVLSEDAGHFVVTLKTRSRDRALKCLRDEELWLRAARMFGALREWMGGDLAQPASAVFTMGGLRNTLRDLRGLDNRAAAGVLLVGDALCHTNPSHGWGVSLALHHARVAAEAVTRPGDRARRTASVIRYLTMQAEPYYRASAGEDAERGRLAAGAAPAWEQPGNPLFCRKVVYPQAVRDPVLLRAVLRRVHLLDPPDRLTGDPALLRRALALHASSEERRTAADLGPSRTELIEALVRCRAGADDGRPLPAHQDRRNQHG